MAKTYIVKSGDTLSSIAKKNNTTVNVLLALNASIKNKNVIKPGWVLTLPGNPSEGSANVPKPSEPSEPDYKGFWELVDKVLTEIHTIPEFLKLMEMLNNGQRS